MCLGSVCLKKLIEETPPVESMVVFPTDLIHQVLKYEPQTLTINAVFKGENSLAYFDVFMPNDHQGDPQIEREYLKDDQSEKIVEEINELLKNWEERE